MTFWIWVFGILSVLLGALFCRVHYYGTPQVKLVVKGTASLSFIVLGCLCAGKAGMSAYAVLMVIGLILGGAGDVLLQLMECFPNKHDYFFRLGLGSFLIGHLLYIIAFMFIAKTTLMQFVLAIALFAVMYALQRPAKIQLGDQKIPVYAYAVIIGLMMGYAVCGAFYAPGVRTALVMVGGLLFVASDVILALMLFSERKYSNSLPAWNLSTYYAAQILLALSIVAV